jgi:hypothetical protein
MRRNTAQFITMTCVRDNQEKFSSACWDAMRDLRGARQAQRRGGNQQDEDDEF